MELYANRARRLSARGRKDRTMQPSPGAQDQPFASLSVHSFPPCSPEQTVAEHTSEVWFISRPCSNQGDIVPVSCQGQESHKGTCSQITMSIAHPAGSWRSCSPDCSNGPVCRQILLDGASCPGLCNDRQARRDRGTYPETSPRVPPGPQESGFASLATGNALEAPGASDRREDMNTFFAHILSLLALVDLISTPGTNLVRVARTGVLPARSPADQCCTTDTLIAQGFSSCFVGKNNLFGVIAR